MTYTFYVQSDNIQGKAKDKARIKRIMKAFINAGHKAKYCGVSSNGHSYPKKHGCTGKNDVWVCVVGGVCPGTIADMTGYWSDWFKKSQLKNAHLMMVFVHSPEGAITQNIENKSYHPRAHDDHFSPSSFKGIKNLAKYMTNKKVSWLEGTTTEIVSQIADGGYKGAVLSDVTGTGKVQNETLDESESGTYTYGFDKDTPFLGYLEIGYIVQDIKGNKSSVKKILIDWSAEAPDVTYKWSYSKDGEDIPLSWINNTFNKCEIDLLSKLQSMEGILTNRDNDTNKYIIKYVDLKYNPMKKYNTSDNTDLTSQPLYETKTDDSSYKMLLKGCGFYSGDIVQGKILGVSGKTLLDAVDTTLTETPYCSYMEYKENRDDDILHFYDKRKLDDSETIEEFNEGFDGTVIGVSNIKYSPITNMINNNIVTYNKKVRNKQNTAEYSQYCHTKSVNLNNILRYGELSKLENSEVISSYSEAKQKSMDDYEENFHTDTTYTLKVTGLPKAKIHDYVSTKMVNDVLSNPSLRVDSMKIDINVDNRPMVQTELGLGEVDNKIKVRKNLEKQRRELIKTKLDINQPITYEDNNTLWGE